MGGRGSESTYQKWLLVTHLGRGLNGSLLLLGCMQLVMVVPGIRTEHSRVGRGLEEMGAWQSTPSSIGKCCQFQVNVHFGGLGGSPLLP